MTAELDLQRQGVMVRALQAALSAGGGPLAEMIETHISFVLLHGESAYKFKKALKNPFLDASTLALREHLCQEELRLNRRLAPDLYRDVVPVAGTPDKPAFGGPGPIIDHAVRMVAFPQAGLWDRLAGEHALGPGPIDELAALLVRFHDAAAPADAHGRLGSPPLVRAQMRENLDELERLAAAGSDRTRVQGLRQWEADLFPRLEALMTERLASGRVRECHGDLHLGNVAQIDGRATVFDAIEFNDEFRWIDVISEVAFVVMDLHAHDLPELAHRLINAWLQASGDYAGLPVLPYYLVHRALVRAKVALMRAAQTDPNERAASAACAIASGADTDAAAGPTAQARRYLALADRFSRPQRPSLMLTHGFSGTGKTTLTQSLVEQAGALRIRADVERKRLAGLDETSRSGSALNDGLYSAAMSAATYDRLFALARAGLLAGWPVILDATFLSRSRRDQARALARDCAVPCVILHFDADLATLRQRLIARARRATDASEADEQVLKAQIREADPLAPDEMADVFGCLPTAGGTGPGIDWRPLMARMAR